MLLSSSHIFATGGVYDLNTGDKASLIPGMRFVFGGRATGSDDTGESVG